MLNRKYSSHARQRQQHTVDDTETWLVNFLNTLRLSEHWVLVRAVDCPSAIEAARQKLVQEGMFPQTMLSFRHCIRIEQSRIPRPVQFSKEASAGHQTLSSRDRQPPASHLSTVDQPYQHWSRLKLPH